MRQIILVAHNLRSAHNVGSLLRTADGLAVSKVYLSGYTPYPIIAQDKRLPHVAKASHKKIAKTALGAEVSVKSLHIDDIQKLIIKLKSKGYIICALEQSKQAIYLPDFRPESKTALIVGREVEGLELDVLKAADKVLEIPMLGKKESYNVAQAAAMALYHLRFA